MYVSKKTISIIIPVWNEAARIHHTLQHLAQLPGIQRAQIILAIGDHREHYPQSVAGIPVQHCHCTPGRSRQMNEAAHLADTETLVFLHADTLLPRTALSEIAHTLHSYAAGAFSLRIWDAGFLCMLTAWMTSLRCRLNHIPFGDQALFFRRDCFFAEQGFPHISIMEDVALMKRLRAKKIPIKILSSFVVTSGRRWQKEGWLYCTLRNWILRICHSFSMDPDKLFCWYPRA